MRYFTNRKNQETNTSLDESEVENFEIEALLEGMFRTYGFDFRDYAQPSIQRQIRNYVLRLKLGSISELQGKILYNRASAEQLVRHLSISVTEMFRDPSMYIFIRKHVVPMIRNLQHIRIWHAGCSTGEEVYSMAIVLKEAGLYDRVRLYATDMNSHALIHAKEGRFPLNRMKLYTKNYLEAGGTSSFSKYYSVENSGSVQFDPRLKEHMIFAEHNLATDTTFNEFNIIICRNVMIYFNDRLRDRVHQLFLESLAPEGLLVLGGKETLHFSSCKSSYTSIDPNERIYQKISAKERGESLR